MVQFLCNVRGRNLCTFAIGTGLLYRWEARYSKPRPYFSLLLYAKKPKTTVLGFLSYCRRPESNRYGRLVPQDFKSCASASSATPASNNVLHTKYKLTKESLCASGWRWIRTTEALSSRFTVCPLWPLGNPPMCQNVSDEIYLYHIFYTIAMQKFKFFNFF